MRKDYAPANQLVSNKPENPHSDQRTRSKRPKKSRKWPEICFYCAGGILVILLLVVIGVVIIFLIKYQISDKNSEIKAQTDVIKRMNSLVYSLCENATLQNLVKLQKLVRTRKVTKNSYYQQV